MRRPRRRSRLRAGVAWLGIAFAAMSSPFAAHAQSSAREVAESWLLRTCDLEPDAAAALRPEAAEVTRLFLEAFRSGPSRRLVDVVRLAARDRFARRARTLATPDAAGLSPRDIERAARVTEEEFVARAVANFVVGYRTQAVRGLVLVQPSLARKLLSSEADDEGSPLRRAARALLRTGPLPAE